MAERGGEPASGFRRLRPLPLGEARVVGAPGAGRARGLVRGFDLVKKKNHTDFLHRPNPLGDGFPRPSNDRGGPRG